MYIWLSRSADSQRYMTTSKFEGGTNVGKKGYEVTVLVRKLEFYEHLKLAALKPSSPEFGRISFTISSISGGDKIAKVPNRDIFPNIVARPLLSSWKFTMISEFGE